MRRHFFIMAFIIVVLSCQRTSTNQLSLPEGINYKHFQLGEGQRPKKGDVINASIILTSLKGDTIHYVPNYPYFFKLENSTVDSLFMVLQPGDSVGFIVDRRLLNDYFKFYQLLETDQGEAQLNIMLKGVYNEEAAKQKERELLSAREIEEQAALLRHLKKDSIEYESIGGVYRKILRQNPQGLPINFGDEVLIQYKGQFLNGYVFDNTYNKLRTPSFIYGKDDQLIDGIHYGLNGMNEGESVKIILPSRRAFGEQGSVAGIVPPYTSVIFEIEVIKVIKRK